MTFHRLAPDFAMDYGRNVVSLAAHRAPSKPLEPETASRKVRLEAYFPWRLARVQGVQARRRGEPK